MICVLPFFPGDQDLALKNAKWMNEIGTYKNHDCLLVVDKRCEPDTAKFVEVEMKKGFNHVFKVTASAQIDGWPVGANYFFRLAATWIQNQNYKYFLWLEPDAIPIKEGWLDAIETEYLSAGKPFMGDRVQVNDVPLHCSGVAVYPNPLHAFAGEAYRAHETAWDIAAKDQIVPKAHWTKLIEHAWRHPQFNEPSEIDTQIRPEAVLFHSSKDGSLIDLLRGRRQPPPEPMESEKPDSPSPISCDIFIRTYPKDYPWLKYCLQSINKFCTGFRKIWVVSPEDAPVSTPNLEWKVVNEESKDGYLAQQIHKLYADVITSYGADYILHVDSDVIFIRPVTPQDFFVDGKLIWYYTPYDKIKAPWKPITEKFLGEPVANEFMRRLPMMIPKRLYANIREFCFKTHGMIISDYIRMQPFREFSEFNALGAYAFSFHKNKFHWVNTEEEMPEPCAKQYFSWSGITDEIRTEIEQILGENRAQGEPVTPSPNGSDALEHSPKNDLAGTGAEGELPTEALCGSGVLSQFPSHATSGQPTDRESLVRDTVKVLKGLCTAPRYTNQVRKELRAQGVIK